MDDPFDRLDEQEIADACAYVDGTLPAARRAEVEARVSASPELTALVSRQRAALVATAALAAEPAPESLRRSVDAARLRRAATAPRRREASRRRRWGWVLSAAGLATAVLVVVAVLTVGGGPATPQVAAAADLALQAPSGPAPAVASPGRLDASVGGVVFPDYQTSTGWNPAGVRSGEVAGRPATVVYYEKGGQRIGYAIVDGAPLPLPDGAARTTRSGVEYLSFEHNGQNVVTWREAGHTCVLAGPAPASELVALAAWSGVATY
jgi:anti-sigma factor RsiW